MDALTFPIQEIQTLAQDMDLGFSIHGYLNNLLHTHGVFAYVVLFLIIFAETGLIIFPFLPGDSLLFVAGALWAANDMNLVHLCLTMIGGAITGDHVNYWVGRYLGPRVFKENARFFKEEHIDYTHAFLEKHGGKTLVVARFIAFARTYAPFIAGVSRMDYRVFSLYSLLGAHMWVISLTTAGFMFGNVPVIKDNLHWVMFGILGFAIIFLVVQYMLSPPIPKKDIHHVYPHDGKGGIP